LSADIFHELLPRLDHREKGGYERNFLPIFDENNNIVHKKTLIYIGPEDGPEFVKNESIQDTAKIIAYSVGPSGKNTEYLFNLRRELLNLKIKDDYLYHLEQEVKRILLQNSPVNIDKKFVPMMNFFDKNDVLSQHFDYKYVNVTQNSIKARMLVTRKHQQPMGILHGGVSVVFAESLGSFGATLLSFENGNIPVGMEINANHINSVVCEELQFIIGEAIPLHVGKNSHIWQIIIKREDNEKIVCISRLTCFIKNKSKL
jgi:1,4-dihydroxy-2-naphthoyl-CoA hydrolase